MNDKVKFAEGFKDVQESFYSMSAALQISEEKLAKSLEREAAFEKEAEHQANEQQKLLEKYHELKEKYADMKGKLRSVMTMDLSATPMPTKIEVKKVVEAEICESSPTPTDDGKRSNKSTRPSSGKGRKSVTQSLEQKSSAKENEEKLTAKKSTNSSRPSSAKKTEINKGKTKTPSRPGSAIEENNEKISSRRTSAVSNAPEIKVEDNKDKPEKEETDEPENEIPTTPRPSKIYAKNECRRESVNDKTDLETEPESEVSSEEKNDDVDQPKKEEEADNSEDEKSVLAE